MPRRQITWGARRVMSRPLKTTRPSSGRMRPEMTLNNVVFPDPFGPIRPTISLCWIEKSTRWRAVTPPNRLTTPAHSKYACISPGPPPGPAEETPGEIKSDRHENGAEQDELHRRGNGELDDLAEHDQKRGPEEGAEQGPGPAEDTHEDDVDRDGGLEDRLGVDIRDVVSPEPAGCPREEGTQHQREHFQSDRGDAQRPSGLLAIADGRQAEPQPGAHDPEGHEERGEHHGKHGEVEERLNGSNVVPLWGLGVQAKPPAGKLPISGHQLEDEAHAHGGDREVLLSET